MTNYDYRFQTLEDQMTAEGIDVLRQYVEEQTISDNILAELLNLKSPWFSEQCQKFTIELAKSMVDEYLVLTGKLTDEDLEKRIDDAFDSFENRSI